MVHFVMFSEFLCPECFPCVPCSLGHKELNMLLAMVSVLMGIFALAAKD